MPGGPSARRLFPLVIKPSSPRHTFAVNPSHNPGFYKRLNETSATMRKTWLPWLILSPSLLFLLLFTWFPPRAIDL
ncbi:Uncharacterised protein [Klebsiella michiganensis]|uniref:Uncharacterized protein n=1 Tax=Klebsiella michiganensis TaxID=1134687 RepID=A0A7H4PQG6_9ENTR|nr:Uncharacterised protein [Klebsiella michiganensis]